ncbi:unnamed protein product [marine sediment metagenome]|uniref:Uncharacterized protein n=1 Tax=marine sediment metagenome TaxID=412755 RepID=X1KD28_9ZZZZ
MAAFHGKGGAITFPNITPIEVISWTVDAVCDVAEGTVMGTDAWKTYHAGFKDWTASVECVLPAAGFVTTLATQLGSEGALSIVSGGDTYAGNAFCTGMSPGAEKDGVGTLSLTFQGSGAVGLSEA